MPRVQNILSVRNALRMSGVLAVTLGAPIALAPAFAVSVILKKRPLTTPPDQTAMNLIMRGKGISILSMGIKSLISPPSVMGLAGDTVFQFLFSLYHLGNRAFGTWEDAGARMNANNVLAPLTCVVLAIQGYALWKGDRPAKTEEASN